MTQLRLYALTALVVICVVQGATAVLEQPLSYDITLTIDYDQGSFNGLCVINYTNPTGESLPELFFRLFANDSSLYGAASIHVDSVSVQTASMLFSLFVDDTVLMVPLNTPLQPEERVNIEFAFTGQTVLWPDPERVGSSQKGYGLLTKSASALTMTAFYPMLAVYTDGDWALDPSTGFGDALMGDSADYAVLITVQSGSTPVTSGKLIATSELEDKRKTYAFTASGARDFALVLVEANYQSKTIELNNATLRTWFTTQAELAGSSTIDMASFSFDLYERLIGPCPFDEIDLVEVPLRHAAGAEFSGLILVSSQYTRNAWQTFYSVIIAHEMAHQWFYAGVGNDVSEHPWLDEGFATYMSYEFLDAYSKTNVAQHELDQWRNVYLAAQQSRSDLAISSPQYAFPDSAIYSAFVYSGGATFLHALRTTLGDDTFYQALQTYYSQFLHRIATPTDLIQTFEHACSCSIADLLLEFRIMP